ncbi:Protein of unknown function [Methylobacterium phyllostachyos]|uniref:DUF3108 domain-containing protein n=1 Tax=Methylobacterium phyllostachyos TaxID=582672 RepID=A0A1H0F078_9HYPH|nr:DUF3108 domain-containing protein [Methylobacterium phyllostachyos]SDN88040.1 Protein of unknown function [Methylobacterium phyllostachyos]
MSATPDHRTIKPLTRHAAGRLVASALAVAALVAPAEVAARAGRSKRTTAPAAATVAVDYGINLAGLPIGTARLAGSFERDHYLMDVSAVLTGLVGAITGGKGSARASGTFAAVPQPGAFSIATHTASSGIAVRMALAHGNVVQAEITPPLIDMQDRVPVTPASTRGILDPVSALLMPIQGRGEPLDPANCNRTLPVFDGATRFNVVLSYAETRPVQKPGYAGQVLVCNARYQAVAGHRPDRPGVKFMEDNREMSVWLAPVEGTRVLLPLRISVLTTIGTNIIEATRWTQSGTAGTTGTAGAEPNATSVAQASLPAQ